MDDTIKATWALGENNGAEINSNKVLVNQVEAVCTAELLVQCVIDLAFLRNEPVNLQLGDQVTLEVISVNEIGESAPTQVTGLYAFAPQAPKNLESDGSVTSNS